MADKKQSNILGWALLAVGAGVGAYALLGGSGTTSGTPVQVPAGGTLNSPWGTWTNNTGANAWVTAAGTLVNGAGTILGNIADIIKAVNAGNNTGSNGGGTDVIIGIKGGLNNNAGAYYNSLPGAMM